MVSANIFNLPNEKEKELIIKTKELIPDMYELSENQENIINNIIYYINYIKEQLEPLKFFDLKYSFGIGGGVIRDLLLDKLPGDVDIIVNIPSLNPGRHSIEYGDDKALYEKFKKTEYNYLYEIVTEISPYYNSHSNVNQFLEIKEKNYCKFIKSFLKIKGKYYSQEKGGCANYQNAHIIGMIKQNGNKKLLPADIIFSSFDIKDYVNTFDFDLCKGYICTNDSYIDTTSSVLENILLSPHMVRDIEKKEMTINIANLSLENLDYYLNKHFFKMTEKFPEYELKTRRPTVNTYKEETLDKLEQYAKSFYLKYKLEEKILNKSSINKKSNKI